MIGADGERLVCIYNDPTLDSNPDWLPLHSIWTFQAVLGAVPSVFDGDVGEPDALRDLCSRCDYAIFSTPGLAITTDTQDPVKGLRRAQKFTPVGVTLGEEGLL